LSPASSLPPPSATEPEMKRSNPLNPHRAPVNASRARRPRLSAMGAAACGGRVAGVNHISWCVGRKALGARGGGVQKTRGRLGARVVR
jgi:hypothetical protein